MIKEHLVMLKGAFTHFHHTGCLWGSSQRAASVLTSPMEKDRGPMNILEVGAGTGAVTVSIIERMREGDSLTICEINKEFMVTLKKRLERMEKYQAFRDHIEFYDGPIQDFNSDAKFDFIVCALPFLNFDLPTIRQIFDKFNQLSADASLMTYFEYLGIRPISKVVSPESRKQRIKEIDAFFKESAPKRINTETCWLNIMPMNVYTLEMAA